MSKASSTTRRRFLHVIAAGGAAASATIVLGCSGRGSGPSGTIAAGTVSELPIGSLKPVPSEAVAIGRDKGGVYAMTLICTHAGCDMESQGNVSPSGIQCNCHGSMFDADGNVLQGPARSPLEHYQVTVDASGNITINADSTVDASVRVAVSG